MRNLFIILFNVLIMTLCVGCHNEGTQTVGDSSTGIAGSIISKKFEYEHHQYIEFKDLCMDGHGFVHDPNCLTCHPIPDSITINN